MHYNIGSLRLEINGWLEKELQTLQAYISEVEVLKAVSCIPVEVQRFYVIDNVKHVLVTAA